MSAQTQIREHRQLSFSELRRGKAYLEREVVPLAQHAGELDDGLHALDFAFDDLVEVFLLDLGEGQEVDGADVTGLGVLGDEFPETLVDALGQERRVGGLQIER